MPTKSSSGSIRVKSLENLFENYKHHDNHHYSHQRSPKIILKNINSSDQAPLKDDGILSPTSSISIEPDSDENQKVISVNPTIVDLDDASKNENENDIGSFDDFDAEFINDDDDDIEETDESQKRHAISTRKGRHADLDELIDQDDDNYDENCHLLPPSLKFNKNTMTIYVKNSGSKDMSHFEQQKSCQRSSTPIASNSKSSYMGDDKFESIVCSPNFVPISYLSNEDEDGDIETTNLDDTERNSPNDLLTESMSSMHDSDLIICDDEIDSDGPSQYQLPQLIQYGFRRDSQKKVKKQVIKMENSNLLRPVESGESSFGFVGKNKKTAGMLLMKMSANRMMSSNNAGGSGFGNNSRRRGLARLLQPKQDSLDDQGNQLPSSVVLRNPRGNQPRTYNTDALYAALMDVKSGESIYR